MIKPKITMISSPDLDDMENNQPQNPDNFCILVQALIGIENEKGAETFCFLVCTPNAIEKRIPLNGGLIGRSYIFIRKYDYQLIWKTIQSICDNICTAASWDDFAKLMGRYSDWEYEDKY